MNECVEKIDKKYLEKRIRGFARSMLIVFVLFGIVFALLIWFIMPHQIKFWSENSDVFFPH